MCSYRSSEIWGNYKRNLTFVFWWWIDDFTILDCERLCLMSRPVTKRWCWTLWYWGIKFVLLKLSVFISLTSFTFTLLSTWTFVRNLITRNVLHLYIIIVWNAQSVYFVVSGQALRLPSRSQPELKFNPSSIHIFVLLCIARKGHYGKHAPLTHRWVELRAVAMLLVFILCSPTKVKKKKKMLLTGHFSLC